MSILHHKNIEAGIISEKDSIRAADLDINKVLEINY